MPFTNQVFAHKLSTLRTTFGQQPAELAKASGIEVRRLLTLESGEAEPSGDELLVLADCFKKDFMFFLSDDVKDSDAEINILFRVRGADISPSDRRAIAEFAYLCRCQAHLEEGLGSRAVKNFQFKLQGSYYKGHAEECAAELRKHLQLERNEVVRDIFTLMRTTGIKVFRRRLENSAISGLFMRHPVAGPCILVNLAEGMERQRFSAAHEWAHAIMDNKPFTFSVIGEWNASELVEVRANTFAARFLVPPELIERINASEWTDPNRVSSIASRLRVSVPVLLYSLVAAQRMQTDQAKEIIRLAPRLPQAPDPELEGSTSVVQQQRREALLERGLNGHYIGLCFDAYGRDLITLGLLSEMLLTTPSGAHEVATLFGRTIGHE